MEYKRFEIAIKVIDEEYVDSLVTALVRQGYSVYYNDYKGDKECPKVLFSVDSDEMHELTTS